MTILLKSIYRFKAAAAAAKLLQLCPTLWDPIDGRPPGSAVPGILQARTLEWVAISFSNAWKWKVKVKSLSRVRFLVTPWTAAYQAPPSMGFSRQEYWSGLPLSSPDLRQSFLNCGSASKASAYNVGDTGSIPWLGRCRTRLNHFTFLSFYQIVNGIFSQN